MAATPKRYAAWTSKRKYAAAIEEVLAERMTISGAAEHFGISRPRLSEKCKEAREAAAAKAAQPAEDPLTSVIDAGPVLRTASSPLGLQEKRRVGTFEDFDAHYFSWMVCPDCDVHHETPQFHTDIMRALDSDTRRLLINMPPYHSKSTIVTVKHSVYQLVKNPNHRRIIISRSDPFAKTFLKSIEEMLTNVDLYGDGPNLIEDWGPFRDSDSIWNTKQIYVAGRNTPEKDPTIQVLGYGGQIYGRRADDIVFDDMADTENQRNPARVAGMLEWVDKMATNRVGRNKGRLIFVGTRVMPQDIYYFLKERPSYTVLRYPLIVDDVTEQTLWPEHFDYEAALAAKDEMSREADFQLVYQNVDTPGLGASFTQEMIDQCKDTNRVLGHYESSWRLIAGLDLAGGNRGSGYTAGVLMGVDLKTGRRYLIDHFNVKSMRAPQLKEQMFEWTDRYPIYEWRVEGNGLQALAVETPLLTTDGWKTMGTVDEGDYVFAPDGSPTRVLATSPVYEQNECYDVEFSDGTTFVADAGHRWFVERITNGRRVAEWTTTADLAQVSANTKRMNRRVALPGPLEMPEADLPVDPYVLGVWLGDGSKANGEIASHVDDQPHVRGEIEMAGYTTTDRTWPDRFGVIGLVPHLRRVGVLNDKHVPEIYLRASVKQRLALLQGLMDSDGSIYAHGRAYFGNTNQRLVEAAEFLIHSLGWKTRRFSEPSKNGTLTKIFFHPQGHQLCPFRLPRKATRVPAQTSQSACGEYRNIRSVRSVESRPVRCLTVEHHSHQFAVGRELVLTGNSNLVQYNDEIVRPLAQRGVRVTAHQTQGNKWDPEFGVESMAPMYSQGLMSIPWGNQIASRHFQPLVEQLIVFPMGMVSDLVMAHWFADLGCRDLFRRASIPLFAQDRKGHRVPERIKRKRRVVDFASGEVRSVKQWEQMGPVEVGAAARGYRRMTVGRPGRHEDMADPEPPEPIQLTNVGKTIEPE